MITIVDAFMAKRLLAIFVGVVFAEITILETFMAKYYLLFLRVFTFLWNLLTPCFCMYLICCTWGFKKEFLALIFF